MGLISYIFSLVLSFLRFQPYAIFLSDISEYLPKYRWEFKFKNKVSKSIFMIKKTATTFILAIISLCLFHLGHYILTIIYIINSNSLVKNVALGFIM